MVTLEEVKQKAIDLIDPEEVLDILELSTKDMLGAFPEVFEEKVYQFLLYLDLDEDEYYGSDI